MDFRQLEYFKAVVEAGAVSRAAVALGMSQPPLSSTIAKLERELGVPLLERTPKGVHPTPAGEYLMNAGARLMLERQRITETMALMGEGLVGEIHVGVEPMVINEIIADVMAQFLVQAPNVRVHLKDVPPDSIMEGLRSGELDMACVPFSVEQLSDSVTEFCDFAPVVKIDLKLAIPIGRAYESHPDGRGWGRWILPHRLVDFDGMPNRITKWLRDDPTFEVLDVSTPQTALPFVAAGLGVSPTTERIGNAYRDVALIDAPYWLPAMHATLLWPRGIVITPAMQRWINVTKEVGLMRD